MSNLFREEVVNKNNRKVDGNIMLSIPIPLSVTTIIFIAFVIITLTLTFQLTYTQKQKLQGSVRISPDNVTVSPLYDGVLKELHVQNGNAVKRGDILAVVQQEKVSQSGDNVTLRSITSLQENIKNISGSYKAKEQEFSSNISKLNSEITLNSRKQNSQKKRVALAERQLDIEKASFSRAQKSFEAQHISEQDFNRAEQSLINAERQLEQERLSLVDLQQREVSMNAQLGQIGLSKVRLKYDTKTQISDIEERIASLEYQYEQSLIASTDGIIEGLTSTVGEKVINKQVLLTITPRDSVAYVDLFAPTSLSTSVSVGDEVKVYVAAYPYQEYGFLTAKVSLIDPYVFMPNNTEQNISISQPSYRIRLELLSMMTSQERKLTLRSGMAVNSDLITEKQTVISWVLEPLNNIKEKY